MFMMREEPLHTSLSPLNPMNHRGSIILSALIMGVVVAIMIFSSAIYIRSRAQSVATSSNKMDNRIALDGMLAYTINGIKQNWCFGDSWLQDAGANCDLKNARNTARLIISDESLNYIGSSGTPRPTNLMDTKLSKIEQTVSLSSINTNHPLYNLARPLNGKFKTVTFTIKRDDSAIATTKGREVRLKILVHLEALSGLELDHLDLESQVIVYPRELSYFSLIVPGSLYLGSEPTGAGQVGFANVTTSGGAGLRFESPVFVNQSLYLPQAGGTAMNNVVFLDKVVLGAGMLYQTGKGVYSPTNAGGTDNRYNYEMPSFKGLMGGYEQDEGLDSGLEFLFGIQPPPAPLDLVNFNRCLARIQASYNLNVTKDSQLFMRYRGYSGPNTFNVDANIGSVDNLVEQFVDQKVPFVINTDTGVSAGTVDTVDGGSVFKVRVVFSGLKPPGKPRGIYSSEFYLSRGGRVTLTPQGLGSGANMSISSTPHMFGGKQQFNQTDMNVTFNNITDWDLAPFKVNSSDILAVQDSVKIFFEAFDYAYSEAKNLRDPTSDLVRNPNLGIYKNNGLTFNRVSGAFQIASTSTAWSTNEVLNDNITGDFRIWDLNQVPEELDWAAIDEACMATPDTSVGSAFYASFPSANWGTSFAKQAKHAWSFSTEFAPTGRFDGNISFGAGAHRFEPPTYPTFKIQSVVRECTIEADANFVTGFYVCETLNIRQRSTPLRIIGTIITGKVNIHESAYRFGIRWSSIYHPQAVYELRTARILGKYKNGTPANCDDSALPPLWSPNLGINSALAHYICNPVSLRTADPFKWTMVDPDCGIDASVNPDKVACKSQPRRFLIKEISRTKGM